MLTLFLYFLLFIFDGLGYFSDKNNSSLVLISFLPTIFFIESVVFKKKVVVLKKIFFLFAFFLVFLTISFFLSIDKINSFFSLVFYLALLFAFIIGFNEKKLISAYLKPFLIISGIIFILGSLIKKPLSYSPLQFIYSTYPNHNHLGDFLGLVIIYLFFDFLEKKQKINLFFILFFLPFFLFSWSRTAYLGGLSILYFGLIYKKQQSFFFLKIIFLSILAFFILSQKEFYQISRLHFVENFLYQKLNFAPRSIVSNRDEYFSQAIKGFLEKPLFGWGPGNFIYPSQKYVSANLQQVSSSLNIFLTILTEGGVFAFLSFFFLVGRVIFSFIKNHKKIDEKYFFIFLYLFINFSFDYTYAIKTFFLLWFFIGGAIYQEKQRLTKEVFLIPSNIALFITVIYLTSRIFYLNNQPSFSRLIFPYQDIAYQNEINQLIFQNQLEKSKLVAKRYLQLTSFYNFTTLSFFVDYYQKINQEKKALLALRFYIKNNRYPSLEIFKKYYLLQKKLEGKKRADKEFFQYSKILIAGTWFNPLFKKEVNLFCFENNIPFCRYAYFYLPKPNSVEKTRVNRYQAVYHFNNLSAHNQSNYSIKKPRNVFRIVILGDSHAFGFLINTKNSWPERLTYLLNQEIKQNSNKKIEIINLSYHNYDLLYQVERYLTDGKKLEPDLIIWMNNNFYRLHEYFTPILEKYSSYDQEPTKTEYQKKGIYFPSWNLASQEYYKQINEKEVFQKQKDAIKEFLENYKGPVIFLSLEEIPQEIKESLLSSSQIDIYELKEIKEDENNFYPKIGPLNSKGHEKIAEFLEPIVFKYVN